MKKYITTTMAVLLLTVLSVGAYASNERPPVKKPYYYTVSTSRQVCDFWDTVTSCYYECVTTTYSVNNWNQVTVVGVSVTQSSTPGGCGAAPRTGVTDPKQMIRDAITDQQRSLPGNEKVVLKFLN